MLNDPVTAMLPPTTTVPFEMVPTASTLPFVVNA